jgi:hypothetical protein
MRRGWWLRIGKMMVRFFYVLEWKLQALVEFRKSGQLSLRNCGQNLENSC